MVYHMMVYGREGVPMKPSRPGKTDPPAKRYDTIPDLPRQNLGRSKLHTYVLKSGRSPNQPCNSEGLGDGVILRKTEQFPSRFSFV